MATHMSEPAYTCTLSNITTTTKIDPHDNLGQLIMLNIYQSNVYISIICAHECNMYMYYKPAAQLQSRDGSIPYLCLAVILH
jgi:hypothetical protein